MFALVESGSITKFLSGTQGIRIGDLKYSADIFSNKWTESERNTIGIYTIEIDKTNFKDIEYYINTDITYAFGSGKVTGSYGTATAKPHADTTYTNTDKSNGDIPDGKDVGDVKDEGLKTIKKRELDGQCAQILAPSDYMAIKAAEGITMDSGWKTWRGNVRTKCNSMQTAITNAADTAAIETLFTYTTTDGVTSRPLGEFPVKE